MFALIHLAPGDPARAFISESNADPGFIEQTRHNLGLDQPLPVQYAKYLGHLVRGDLGTAYTFNSKPVLELIMGRIGATVMLQGDLAGDCPAHRHSARHPLRHEAVQHPR